MKIKLEANVQKLTVERPAEPWYARSITSSLWAHIARLLAAFGLGILVVILVKPWDRQAGHGPQAPPSAVFLKTDTATQGNWKGVYGSTGFALARDGMALPEYGVIGLPSKDSPVIWTDEIDLTRALQKVKSTRRIAATWWAWGSFDIDLNLKDDKTHRVSLYVLDWDSDTRVETVEILNAMSANVLDVRQASNFTGGAYLCWNMSGHVVIRVTHVAGANAVASALFFD